MLLKQPYLGSDVLPAEGAHRHLVATLVAGLVPARKGQAAPVLHAHGTAQGVCAGLALVLDNAALQDHLAHGLGARLEGGCRGGQRGRGEGKEEGDALTEQARRTQHSERQ